MYVVYKIINNINDKVYIGMSKNIDKRKKRHLSDLKNKKHHSIYLQRFYDKYSDSLILSFEIISENLDYDSASILEEDLIIKNYSNSFNVSKLSSGGDLISYHPNKDNIISKQKETIKALRESGEIKSKAYFGQDNPNYKHGLNVFVEKFCITCNKDISTLARYTSVECTSCLAKKRLGDKNPFYGKEHTNQVKETLREKALLHFEKIKNRRKYS